MVDAVKFFERHKITPIYLPDSETGEFDFHLGSGINGSVYRGAYLGKQVAVKITNVSEVPQWESIMRASAGAPDDIKKHLPLIYKMERDGDYEIIVMETLKPLSGAVRDMLWPEGPEQSVRALMSDPNLVHRIFDSVASELPNNGVRVSRDRMDEIFKILLRYNEGETATIESFIRSNLSPPLSDEIASQESIFIKGLDYWFNQELMADMPKDSDNDTSYKMESLPESRSLLAAMRYLKSKGISWGDMNSENFMMRPSTGDIVMIDVGAWN